MEDIGPSPDWRSGISEYGTCHICGRYLSIDYLEPCADCGRWTCPDCRAEDDGMIVLCLVCEEP